MIHEKFIKQIPILSLMSSILESAEMVARNARHLSISYSKAKELAEELVDKPIPKWDMDVHYKCDDQEKQANYLLVLDALNFCFWPTFWAVEYNGKVYNGYMGLAASLKRAIEEGKEIWNKEYLKGISLEDLKEIFRGDGEIALIEKRLEILHEIAENNFLEIIKSSKNSAVVLAEKIAKTYPSFNDVAEYKKQKVPIFKRAQILVADLWGAFEGKGLGQFDDINKLTIFADYKLPQILRHFNIINYFGSLSEKVDKLEQIESGSEEEIEIRCATIYVCDIIREELQRLGRDITSLELDWLLWNLSQDKSLKMKPYHKTLTHFY